MLSLLHIRIHSTVGAHENHFPTRVSRLLLRKGRRKSTGVKESEERSSETISQKRLKF